MLVAGDDINLWRGKYQFDVSADIQRGKKQKKKRLMQLASFKSIDLEQKSEGPLSIAASLKREKTMKLMKELESQRYKKISIDLYTLVARQQETKW